MTNIKYLEIEPASCELSTVKIVDTKVENLRSNNEYLARLLYMQIEMNF
jgi:hypothetical protein